MVERRFGSFEVNTVLLIAAVVVMVLGVVQSYADNPPNQACVEPTKTGCSPQVCAPVVAMCSSMMYSLWERSTYDYRLCAGAATPCQGWSANYKTCETRYYNINNCADTPCKITTTLSACSP